MSEDVQNDLAAEADAARDRIAERLETLQTRLEPKKIVRETVAQARGVAAEEIRRSTAFAGDFLRENAVLLGAVGAAGVGIALAMNLRDRAPKRREPTPLYDAYSMEDPSMHDTTDTGPSRLDRIRDGAADLRARASDRYGETRERLGERYAATRQRVGETAEQYADRARQEAAQAADWARRQPDENPMGTAIAAFALGALIGAVLPRSRAENRALGPTKAKLVDEVKAQADAALEAGKAKLAEQGITTEAAKAKLAELTDQAKHVAKDVASASAGAVKTPSLGGQQQQGATGGQSQTFQDTGSIGAQLGAGLPGQESAGGTTDRAAGYAPAQGIGGTSI